MLSLEEVRKRVENHIAGAQVEVADMTGGGDHLEIKVVASAFEGKSLVTRHRMVYSALGSSVGGEIHAARLVTQTPDESKRG